MQFMEMGGYGGYIWPAFGIVLAVMAFMWIAGMRGWRKSEQVLASLRSSRRQREDIAE
ncbi:MAG: heme exporter protein CcmD [Alphaproteobacteria bacterium]